MEQPRKRTLTEGRARGDAAARCSATTRRVEVDQIEGLLVDYACAAAVPSR
ncbi:MAG: hypothetical protein U0325_31660 [Polyangiales bacterium]